ncbi:hypothetical protein MHC_04125 [Mycoplasma haemocanis str. Illinois]|uniref:Uncharacterized protein n=1 Tax=Mycoplasma haemocanis (strain Illinois) TaxID=1111676 RepID=H6N7Q9_MYCHN|nr:hypothetical protein [Mycoplasma haemocanis]AEW45681.1 hypothetical protein MHC_04125 [Mycoplasma haemocanis str. Illinois]
MNIKLLLPPLAGGLGITIYAFSGSNENRYRTKISVYKNTFDKVKEHRKGKSGGLYLVDPNNKEWWMKRAKEMKKFYKGDWQDFRDKCFEAVKSKEAEWDTILGRSGDYFGAAYAVPSSFDFVALCVEKEEDVD